MNIKPIVAIIGVGLMVSGLACYNTQEPRPRCFPLGPETQPYFVGGIEQDSEGLYVNLELELLDGFAEGSHPECSVDSWASAIVGEVDNSDKAVEIVQSVESISKNSYVIRLTDNAKNTLNEVHSFEMTFSISEFDAGINASVLLFTVQIGPTGVWTIRTYELDQFSYV